MEHLIAKLLQDFEHGKMSRRQLIQGLALTATAATAVGAAPAASAAGSGLHAVAINHITFDVHNFHTVGNFYADLFGMKMFQGTDKNEAHLKIADTYLTLRNPGARKGPQPPTPRVDHIAIGIDPWDRNVVEAELKKRGLPNGRQVPDADPFNNNLVDPEGFHLQIVAKKYQTSN